MEDVALYNAYYPYNPYSGVLARAEASARPTRRRSGPTLARA